MKSIQFKIVIDNIIEYVLDQFIIIHDRIFLHE